MQKGWADIFVPFIFALLFHICVYQHLFIDCRALADVINGTPWNNSSKNDHPMYRSERTDLNRHLTTYSINSSTDMTHFFNQTYIERLGGEWDVKNKRYLVPGYINGWEMFHFHHVCIRWAACFMPPLSAHVIFRCCQHGFYYLQIITPMHFSSRLGVARMEFTWACMAWITTGVTWQIKRIAS